MTLIQRVRSQDSGYQGWGREGTRDGEQKGLGKASGTLEIFYALDLVM